MVDGVGSSGQLQIPVNAGQAGRMRPVATVTVGQAGKTMVELELVVAVLRGQVVARVRRLGWVVRSAVCGGGYEVKGKSEALRIW